MPSKPTLPGSLISSGNTRPPERPATRHTVATIARALRVFAFETFSISFDGLVSGLRPPPQPGPTTIAAPRGWYRKRERLKA